MEALFGKQAYKLIGRVQGKLKTGEPLTGMERMVAEVMKEHPEFDPVWGMGEQMAYPQEIDGMIVNPLVHTGLHVVAQKQIDDDDPEEARMVVEHLKAQGKSHHDALHVIAQVWGNHYFRSIRSGETMEEFSYTEDLKNILT